MSTAQWQGTDRSGTAPQTAAGWWSVAFLTVFLVGALALFGAAASGQTGGEAMFDNLWLAIPGLVGPIGAVASTFAGLFAMIRRDDRAPAVVASTTVSVAVLGFVVLSVLLG
jgi:hypothetical protein